MDVLDLVVGKLAIQRQLLAEPAVQQALRQAFHADLSLAQVLVRGGFGPPVVEGLVRDAELSQLYCSGCSERWGVAQMNPEAPWSCRRCGSRSDGFEHEFFADANE